MTHLVDGGHHGVRNGVFDDFPNELAVNLKVVDRQRLEIGE